MFLCAHMGSPPRMRGILNQAAGKTGSARITPAHAGNTIIIHEHNPIHQDHPRACGEYVMGSSPISGSIGSPPRMRGIPFPRQRIGLHPGITPAHAGNTSALRTMSTGARDHPRACGEYCYMRLRVHRATGSPPRMRGIPNPCGKAVGDCGITPAHAGNTL